MSVSDGRPLDLGLLSNAVFYFTVSSGIFALKFFCTNSFTQLFQNVTIFTLPLVPLVEFTVRTTQFTNLAYIYYTVVPITDLHLE